MNNPLHENGFMDSAHLEGVTGGAGGFTYTRIKRECAFMQKKKKKKKKKSIFFNKICTSFTI